MPTLRHCKNNRPKYSVLGGFTDDQKTGGCRAGMRHGWGVAVFSSLKNAQIRKCGGDKIGPLVGQFLFPPLPLIRISLSELLRPCQCPSFLFCLPTCCIVGTSILFSHRDRILRTGLEEKAILRETHRVAMLGRLPARLGGRVAHLLSLANCRKASEPGHVTIQTCSLSDSPE